MLKGILSWALSVATVQGVEYSKDSFPRQNEPSFSAKTSKTRTQNHLNAWDDDLDGDMFHTFKTLPRNVSAHFLGKKKPVKSTYSGEDDHSVPTLIHKFEHLFGQSPSHPEESGEEDSGVMGKVAMFENLVAHPPSYDSSHKITPEFIQKEIRKIESKGVQLPQKKNFK